MEIFEFITIVICNHGHGWWSSKHWCTHFWTLHWRNASIWNGGGAWYGLTFLVLYLPRAEGSGIDCRMYFNESASNLAPDARFLRSINFITRTSRCALWSSFVKILVFWGFNYEGMLNRKSQNLYKANCPDVEIQKYEISRFSMCLFCHQRSENTHKIVVNMRCW